MLKDLSCIKVVPGDCKDCFFKEPCSKSADSIIGELFSVEWCKQLIPMGSIFKMEERWEICTRENTKVDATVLDGSGVEFEVSYILRGRNRFILFNSEQGKDTQDVGMENFKIKVK